MATAAAPEESAPSKCFPTVTHVILDLDGTLINTEQLVDEVVTSVLDKRGEFTAGQLHKAIEQVRGMRPKDGTKAILQILQLDTEIHSVDDVLAETGELLNQRWGEVNMMPGAKRLLDYLHEHGIKTALATSTPSDFLEKKMESHDGWIKKINVVATGDEVENGKPAPDIFTLAMERLGVSDAKKCIVLEDTSLGVQAAKASGAFAIAIPSIQNDQKTYETSGADSIIKSLYDFQPERWGLPGFEDYLDVQVKDTAGETQEPETHQILPLHPAINLGGPVVKGFGRGSKTLGVPTANLEIGPIKLESDKLAPGIYFGWAGLRDGEGVTYGKNSNTPISSTYPMVMSIGWNPFFENSQKTCEPWLLHDFGDNGDFYGRELRLSVLGYIRPEANFVSLESLIERIHKDASVAKAALDLSQFRDKRKDTYLLFGET